MDLWNGLGMGLPVAGIGWLGLRWILRRGNRHPAALAGAQQIWTEREFSMDEPVRLVARVDAAWRLESGEIVLVEVKHRRGDKVYRSDVLQLSAQREAVMADSGQSVVGWAFVCLIRGGLWRRPRWHRVELMDEREVVEVVRRRLLLLEGTIEPRAAHGGRVCRSCSWRRKCNG